MSPNEEYYNIPMTLVFLSGLYLETGHPEKAGLLLGFAEKQLESTQKLLDDWDKIEYERIAAQAKAAIDKETFGMTWARGREMTLEQALACAEE